MGLLLAQAKIAQLNSYRADLEYNVNLIMSTKTNLAKQVTELTNLGSDMDVDRPEMKALEEKLARLKEVDKALDQKMQNYQTQLELVDSQMQYAQQMRSSAIQRNTMG